MSAYRMRGTPTLILIDRDGRIRRHEFGRPDDLSVGASIGLLLAERDGAPHAAAGGGPAEQEGGCDDEACVPHLA